MKNEELKERTKQFALRVIRMTDSLPRKMTADVLGRQVLRSATSVAANYRSACRAKSRADFISKMGTVEEEADESVLWLELIGEAGLMPASKLMALHDEASELTAIAVASIRTARKGRNNPQSAISDPRSP
ncbi:MAG: four helix bundle protein [Opitutaceae bacterium]|nr:four helix bundle protein [Opitutaceae bacterium]